MAYTEHAATKQEDMVKQVGARCQNCESVCGKRTTFTCLKCISIRGRNELPAVTGHPGRNGASGATDQLIICIIGRFLICVRLVCTVLWFHMPAVKPIETGRYFIANNRRSDTVRDTRVSNTEIGRLQFVSTPDNFHRREQHAR